MSELKEQYKNKVVKAMTEKFGYKSVMQVPKLSKIVINIGLGDTRENPKALENAIKELAQITGQKPIITKAKKSIAAFKIREGVDIGCKVTLRSDKMYDLLGENSDYLPAQLQWCLDKNLLQQALVLVETKTACQLKNSGIIEVEAWRKAECPDEDENKLCINQFVTFINKSLFSDCKGWKNYKGQKISSNDLFSVYFKQMNQQQTQIFTN